MKQRAATTSSKLVIVLSRAYWSLAEFLEGGLALQGIWFTDFMILEALLHKGPLAVSVIATKIVQLPNAAMEPALDRLIQRGLIRRQTGRNAPMPDVFELTPEGRNQVTSVYQGHERDIEAVMGILSPAEKRRLGHDLKRIGHQADRCRPARSKDRRGGLAPWQLRRVTEYMSGRVASSVRLSELAAQSKLSPSRFGRAFKLSMGVSPHRWQINLRIRLAQDLLREGNLSLAEVSLATGFTEQSHFSRVFKQAAGVSPRAWQREHRL